MTDVESADKLNECNDGKRSSEVLLKTLEELEKVKSENEKLKNKLEIAKAVIYSVLHDKFINENADAGLVMYITGAYQKIKELEK